MGQVDVDAALIEQADERKVRAGCRLDAVNRAPGSAGFEEHTVRIAAERERAGDVFGEIGTRDEPRLDLQRNDLARDRFVDSADARRFNGDRPPGRAAQAAVTASIRQLEVEPEEFHEPFTLSQVTRASLARRATHRDGAPAGRRLIWSERVPPGAGITVFCLQGNQRNPGEQLTGRQHRWSRRTDQGRPSICPGVTSERKSKWRSANKCAVVRFALRAAVARDCRRRPPRTAGNADALPLLLSGHGKPHLVRRIARLR